MLAKCQKSYRTLILRWDGDFLGSPVVKNFILQVQEARVRSLVGELGSHMPCGMANNKKRCFWLEYQLNRPVDKIESLH